MTPITGAYQQAAGGIGVRGKIPTMREFFESLLTNGYYRNVTYEMIQRDWDTFVAASPNLLPMTHADFAPDREEVLVTVLMKAPQVRQELQQWCTAVSPGAGGARTELVEMAMGYFEELVRHQDERARVGAARLRAPPTTGDLVQRPPIQPRGRPSSCRRLP